MNRNLINMCLLNNSFPYQLFSYLKDKNVSISHLDTDNYNLLNFFPIIYFKKELGEIFINLCQHNDITNENKFKDSCISSFIDFISSDNTSNNEKTHLQWLTFIFQRILDKKIPINNKSQLLKILNVNTDKYSSEAKQIISLQNETIGFIKYLILDEKFPIKNVDSKKIKI